MPTKNRISLTDFYKNHYEYPCYDVTSGTIPKPYIPKSQVVCDHPRSLTFKQYSMFYRLYAKYLKEYLMSGLIIKLPSFLGQIRLKKFKPVNNKRFNLHHYIQTGEKKYYNNRHTMGYFPYFKWTRKTAVARLTHRWMWKCIPTYNMWKSISDDYIDDGSKINKLIDTYG